MYVIDAGLSGNGLPSVPDVSDNRGNISSQSDSLYDNSSKLKGLENFKNSIVAGDNNFSDIVDDFKRTSETTTKDINQYLTQASSVMTEILRLISFDNSVRWRAQQIYDNYMAETEPHKKTVSIGSYYDQQSGKLVNQTKTVSTLSDDMATAAAKRDKYWRDNNSWVWED